MSEFPIPDNVKEVLSHLSVADQVVIRSYIAGIRDQLKEYKARVEHGGDAHAHFHGHELCTSDHGHSHGHADASDMVCDQPTCEGGHNHHEHKHEHAHHHDHQESHDHEHKHHDHEHKHHDHAHEHHGGHEHDHNHKEDEDDIPAWKKRALESGGDATAAPFGGSWNTERSLDATK